MCEATTFIQVFVEPKITYTLGVFIILYNTAILFRVSNWMVMQCILFIYTFFSSIYTAPVQSLT